MNIEDIEKSAIYSAKRIDKVIDKKHPVGISLVDIKNQSIGNKKENKKRKQYLLAILNENFPKDKWDICEVFGRDCRVIINRNNSLFMVEWCSFGTVSVCYERLIVNLIINSINDKLKSKK